MKSSIWKIENPVEYERNRLIKNACFFIAVFFFCIVVLLFGVFLCSFTKDETSIAVGMLLFTGLVTVGCLHVVINISEQQFYYLSEDGKIITT
jgi:hypothetical protein